MVQLFGKKMSDEEIEAACREVFTDGENLMKHLATLDDEVHLPASEKRKELLAYVQDAWKLWEPIGTKLLSIRKTLKPY